MAYLIALIPALGWGFMPLITGKVGGSEANQIFGIGAGASLVGLVAFLIMHPQVSMKAFLFSLLCGALWSTAQVGQFVSFKRIGVSNTVPLSTVFQLVGNSIIGVLIFGEWHSARALTIGFIALAIVIIGAMMTSFTDRSNGQNVTTKDVLFLLATTIGYWIYSSFPKMPILAHEDSVGIFLPEVLGILLGAIIYDLASGNAKAFTQKEQYTNILAGISWGIAAFAYIFAARMIGVTVAFVFTQLNVIIATFGGILILHEHKSPRESKFTFWGIVLIVIGSIATAFA
ncbi:MULTISPECIES: GRP family sugar transporter [Limosilactobacillus]|jgi:glucose uptake protein|uniref:Glucose uptake protein GlcU n=2 Tax=Limosilactobacillus mucosae TaxID=97478 RepID=A0A099Y9X3_LIMMU|nr:MULTISPECIES: GRP family sugar transporter [Limosilactobacillus]RRG02944.1 MAG: sugar transporter [Lactobacillus sp.]KGL66227.1 sugar transporter [Limosilactobacillus mucosae]KRL27651.1 DMT superfamily drug metabolite transporter [Limosilactobacillus mucosae DSM 13345]MCC6097466.1 GRP family sugar transporter [Limosilactobacillus sp.]MDE8676590.1 GRP family sugar transporter [Limosilactobacillus mucosae]